MKTLLFLLFPILFYSQTSFKNLDSAAFISQIDAIIKTTGTNYKFVKYDTFQTSKILVFSNPDKVDDEMIFFYQSYQSMEDKNLGLLGLKQWDFTSIRGNYQNLFSIWKKFIDPDGNKEAISKQGYKSKNGYLFKVVSSPEWLIRF